MTQRLGRPSEVSLHCGTKTAPALNSVKPRFDRHDLFYAWLAATLFSGVPSTLHALVTGADPLEATRAAGAMLRPAVTETLTLVSAAALVHSSVSLFWAVIFVWLLPHRYTAAWAVAGSAAVALLDLRLIAPSAFPAVAALPFWPQFADHLMWGLMLGATLQARLRSNRA